MEYINRTVSSTFCLLSDWSDVSHAWKNVERKGALIRYRLSGYGCVTVVTSLFWIKGVNVAAGLTRIWLRSCSASCRNCSSSLMILRWGLHSRFTSHTDEHAGLQSIQSVQSPAKYIYIFFKCYILLFGFGVEKLFTSKARFSFHPNTFIVWVTTKLT